MQSPLAEATESERRARLLQLEERQRRLQELCEAALKEEEEQQRVLDHLESRNASFNGAPILSRLTPPPGFPFSQSPDQQRRGEGGLAPPPASYTSRSGGVGRTAPYTDDLLTGEVQSFRDPNSIARASSVNTIRDRSLPQGYGGGFGGLFGPPSGLPPQPPAGARPVAFTLHDTRGVGGRARAPPEPTEQYVQGRLLVDSGERDYRRHASNGMVETPVYDRDARDTPATPRTTGASLSDGVGNDSRSAADLSGLAGRRTARGPAAPPPPPERSQSPSHSGDRPKAATARPPPPPPMEDSDGRGGRGGRRDGPPPPPSATTAPRLSPAAAAETKPTDRGPAERRRALRERYGVRPATAPKTWHVDPQPQPPPPPPPPVLTSPPPPTAPTTAGLFDTSDEDTGAEPPRSRGGSGGWRELLRDGDARLRAGPRPRRGSGGRPPPPPPPSAPVEAHGHSARPSPRAGRWTAPRKDDKDGGRTSVDPWERPSLSSSMLSAEARTLDAIFAAPWQGDDTANRRGRWERERDALSSSAPARARTHRRRLTSPAPPEHHHSRRAGTGGYPALSEDGADRSQDRVGAATSASFLEAAVASSSVGAAGQPSPFPNPQSHPYAGGGDAVPVPMGSARPPPVPAKPKRTLSLRQGHGSRAGGLAAPRAAGSQHDVSPTAGSGAVSSVGRGVGGRPADDVLSNASGLTGASHHIGTSAHPIAGPPPRPDPPQRQPSPGEDLACFDEDPGKAALRDLLQKPPRTPVHPEPAPQGRSDSTAGPTRARSPSGRTSGGSYAAASPRPGPSAGTGDDVLSQVSGRKHSRGSALERSVTPLPTAAAQVELRHAQRKSEALARHLVKAIQEKKVLLDSVEQLEELIEESNMEVGRLQRIVEEQSGESHATTGLHAALRAKEREIAVCEGEIQRLSSIIDAHARRLAAREHQAGEDSEGGGVVARAVELDAAMTEVGVAHMNQREAEERAEQLQSELEAAVEQIRALDERLAEMERAATAARLQEMRADLRAGSGRRSSAGPAAQSPPITPTGTLASASTAAVPLPSAEEAAHWPMSARRALAEVVTHAEDLLAQNSAGALHAAGRLRHLEYACEDLQRQLREKQAELHGLQHECLTLRKDKSAMLAVGNQWFKQLQEVKADAQLVSEVVRTSRGDAEDVVLTCRTAEAHVEELTRATSPSPFLPVQPPPPATINALQRKNEMARDFAQQVMRDLRAVARFLAALREMDIGESSGYQVLLSLAAGQSPSEGLRIAAEADERRGDHSPGTVRALAAGHEAVVRRVREKRDFVVQAVERALDGDLAGAALTAAPIPTPPLLARRLELRRSSSVRSTPSGANTAAHAGDGEEVLTQADEWTGEYPGGHDALSDEACAAADGFEVDHEQTDAHPTRPPTTTTTTAPPRADNTGRAQGTVSLAGLVASGLRSDRTTTATAPPPPVYVAGGEAVPLARPLRLSSTPPEHATALDEAAVRAAAGTANRHLGGGSAAGAVLVSSPFAPPTRQGRSGPRVPLHSPSPDREPEEERPTAARVGGETAPPPPPASTLSTPPAKPQAGGRTPVDVDEEDDDSPQLTRPAETTAAYESSRQSAGGDQVAPLPSHGERLAGGQERRSGSPPAVPVPAVVTADSPLKSKSASVEWPPASHPPPPAVDRDGEGAPSLPKERSTTAPPLAHRHHGDGSAGERERDRPEPRPRRANDPSDSDYDEATLVYGSGGGRGTAGGSAPPRRSIFNRIAALDPGVDGKDASGGREDGPAPHRDEVFAEEEEEVTYVEERPPPPSRPTAAHPPGPHPVPAGRTAHLGRRLPGTDAAVPGEDLDSAPAPATSAGETAAPPAPPRLQRSASVSTHATPPAPVSLTPGSTGPSGRETPLGRDPAPQPPPRRSFLNPATPAAAAEPGPGPRGPCGSRGSTTASPGGCASVEPDLPACGPEGRPSTPLEQVMDAAAREGPAGPPELGSTALPPPRQGRAAGATPRESQRSSSSSSCRTGLDRPRESEAPEPADARADRPPPASAAQPTNDRDASWDRAAEGGLGLPGAPASLAEPVPVLDPSNLSQPAAPLSMGRPDPATGGAGDSGGRPPPPRAGGRPPPSSPEVRSLPRVGAEGGAAGVPPPAVRVVHLTTRGRSGSANARDRPAAAEAGAPTARPGAKDTDVESLPTKAASADGGTSLPSKPDSPMSTSRSTSSSNQLYEPEALQKRKEDVARILQRLKEKKSRDESRSGASSTTPSLPPQ